MIIGRYLNIIYYIYLHIYVYFVHKDFLIIKLYTQMPLFEEIKGPGPLPIKSYQSFIYEVI